MLYLILRKPYTKEIGLTNGVWNSKFYIKLIISRSEIIKIYYYFNRVQLKTSHYKNKLTNSVVMLNITSD